MSAKSMEYFNKQPRLGTLSTANKAGNVNVAYCGSPRMVEKKRCSWGLAIIAPSPTFRIIHTLYK